MRPTRLLVCSVAVLLASTVNLQSWASAPADVLLGFSSGSTAAQRQQEQKFQAAVSVDNIRENMRRLSARPHHVGSPYDKDNALWILAKFKEWGFDAHIETFDVLFPTPKSGCLNSSNPRVLRPH